MQEDPSLQNKNLKTAFTERALENCKAPYLEMPVYPVGKRICSKHDGEILHGPLRLKDVEFFVGRHWRQVGPSHTGTTASCICTLSNATGFQCLENDKDFKPLAQLRFRCLQTGHKDQSVTTSPSHQHLTQGHTSPAHLPSGSLASATGSATGQNRSDSSSFFLTCRSFYTTDFKVHQGQKRVPPLLVLELTMACVDVA